MWLQFRNSGIYFRSELGKLVQGASLVCNDNDDDDMDELHWELVSWRPAQKYYDEHPEYFTPASDYYLDFLMEIPSFLCSHQNIAWCLEIIAED
jgi:hypothetical protein